MARSIREAAPANPNPTATLQRADAADSELARKRLPTLRPVLERAAAAGQASLIADAVQRYAPLSVVAPS
ncbi:MAG: hypothetical protein AAB270_01625 [Chloroflexota bacterium]